MTVYNAGRFLDPAIRSITNQVFRDWEFVIVDDASTDGSTDVLQSWADAEPRIRLILNPANKGQTPCLNQGLREARGQWVARQDADDLSHPLRLLRQHERVTIHPALALLGTCGRIIDENDQLVGLLDAPATAESISWWSPFLNPFVHTSVMFRREVIWEEFGGYDETFRIAQDYELWTRVAAQCPTANLIERLVCYRHLSNSLSKTGREVAFDEADRISAREAERVFKKQPDQKSLALLSAFRKGIKPETHADFWRLYDSEFVLKMPQPKTDAALHRLKSAGSVGGLTSVMDVLHAFRMDFRTTFAWLRERYL